MIENINTVKIYLVKLIIRVFVSGGLLIFKVAVTTMRLFYDAITCEKTATEAAVVAATSCIAVNKMFLL